MKKVVFLVPSLGMGGMERVLVNYANLFVKRGYDVTVLNFTFDDPGIVEKLSDNVHYYKSYSPVKNIIHSSIKDIIHLSFRLLPWKIWLRFHSSAFLHKKYIKERFDIEIAFFGIAALKILCGADCGTTEAVGWLHNVNVEDDIIPLGGYERAKDVYNRVPKLICVSERSKEKVVELFGRKSRIYVVNNPNDTKTIRELAKEEISLEKQAFTFVVVARFDDHQKGFFRLLNVCKKLNNDGYRYNLWLVGDGSDYRAVFEKAKEYNLSNVSFLGKQDNPYPYISNADMYLCSSYFEGFSMVMMEAIILGKPMLTTDVSGADEMLDGGKYGMIVENSEEGLYNGMKRILTDPDLYKHYCEMAELRKDYLSEEKIMDQVEAILEE